MDRKPQTTVTFQAVEVIVQQQHGTSQTYDGRCSLSNYRWPQSLLLLQVFCLLMSQSVTQGPSSVPYLDLKPVTQYSTHCSTEEMPPDSARAGEAATRTALGEM